MDLFARAIEAVRVEVKADRIVLVGHSCLCSSISATHRGFGLRRWLYAPAGDAGRGAREQHDSQLLRRRDRPCGPDQSS
jgi:hypothetical protein